MIYVNSCGHDSHHPKPCNIEHKRGVPDYLILLIKRESWIYLDGENTRSLPTPSFVSRRILISTMAVMPSGITMTGSIFFRMPRNGIFS